MKTSIPNDQYHMETLPRIPLPIDSVGQLLTSHAGKFPRKAAIVAVDVDSGRAEAITYGQLDTLVRRAAAWLSTMGINRGDRFAILMQNTPEVLILELAGAMIGAATVPLDIKRDTQERKLFKLKDTRAKALFIKYEKEPPTSKLPDLIIQSWKTFADFITLLPSSTPIEKTAPALEDSYVILYTSGTTALPKGVMLSTRSCLLNAMGIVAWQQFTGDDVFNIILPLHHINSTEFCLAILLVGGTIVINSRYSTSKFWHIIHTYNVTSTSIVPTILHDLLTDRNNSIKTPTLKRICIGSAPVLPEETMRFYNTFGVRVTQGYGQTETALRVAGVPVDTDEKTYRELIKNNTIGTELANNHLAIMDEKNNEKKEGEEGEICIAGPILAEGYLNNPEETAKSFKNGWFHSGDLGYWKTIDGKKYFFIIGRIKEIIIKGGINLSPSAIEDALLKAFPQIDEVCVVGYPGARMGEEIAAVIVLKRPGLRELQGRALSVPGLSLYETPKKIFFVDTLPKTSTGKIQRVEIKKIVAKLIKHYSVRQVAVNEKNVIKRALEINNSRFPFVPATLEEFCTRTQNGLFFGVFDDSEDLIGSLSCVRAFHPEKLTTWNEAVKNHNPKGDTLLCIAISVKLSRRAKLVHFGSVKVNPEKYIEEYVRSGKDHVLEFHKKPKGGLPGATVWKILENGRPEDKEAMGYNVLMKYPEITKGTKIEKSNAASPSVLLIEHALLYAKEHGIKGVFAFSRPSGFRKYLEEKSRI